MDVLGVALYFVLVQHVSACDFENGFCSWKQSTTDVFDWRLQSGSTGSSHTGPSYDHTMGYSSGKYIYIEASAPRVHNDNAILTSALLTPDRERCLTFWYHMYGGDIGFLNVRMMSHMNNTSTTLWTKSGNQGDEWRQATISIPPQSNEYLIEIEGIRGVDIAGDIALDDIAISETKCPYPVNDAISTRPPIQSVSTTTGPGSGCLHSNITKQLVSGQKTINVEIGSGQSLQLPAGHYQYMTTSPVDNCTIHISVIEEKLSESACPTMINSLTSAKTNLSNLSLTFGETTHTLRLPAGEYQYLTSRRGENCSTLVTIYDYNIVRRMKVAAEYKVACNKVSDVVTRSSLELMANNNLYQIEGLVCEQDCKRLIGSKANLSCTNNTLRVTWSTDRTFSGEITQVPADLRSRLTTRLEKFSTKLRVFQLVVLNHKPPVVQPNRWDIFLSTECLNNQTYVADKDSCHQ